MTPLDALAWLFVALLVVWGLNEALWLLADRLAKRARRVVDPDARWEDSRR